MNQTKSTHKQLNKSWYAKCKEVSPAGDVHISISNSIDELKDSWDIGFHKEMMSAPYLSSLEKAAPGSMSFVYATLSHKGKILGKAYYQILYFNAAKSLAPELTDTKTQKSFFKNLGFVLKEGIAKNISFYTLVNGNLLLTGDYAADFKADVCKEDRLIFHRLINRAVREHIQGEQADSVPVFLMKECYGDCRLPEEYMSDAHIHEFCIEPNFLMEIPDNWQSFDDYLEALKGKYRMRAKRALKKAEGVIIHNLSLEEIRTHKMKLFDLYQKIASQIGFNMVQLNPLYFENVKEQLKDQFCVSTFEKDGQIIGFFSYFLLEKEIVAHYVGFEPECAKDHQLYLNMLLTLISVSIGTKKLTINFGRTAHEIKSSVGAKPVDMYCYIRHKNKLYQALVPRLLDYLSPKEAWEERHPFKD